MVGRRRTALAIAAVTVVAWGAVHVVSTPPAAVTPAVWPSGAGAATSTPLPSLGVASASSSPAAAPGGVPFLPGAMQQLNASTETTATGIWALLQELEIALGQRLGALVRQLEPGR